MGKKLKAGGKGRPESRAPKGTGTVFWCARRKRYVARKPIGVRAGRTVYVERTGRTQAEAIRRRDAAAPPEPSVTVAAWADRWLASLDRKPQTLYSYRRVVATRIVPLLGPRPVAALTPFDVQEAVRAWGKRVAAGTVRQALAVLSGCLAAAAAAGVAARNVAAGASVPAQPRPRLQLFTADELRRVVEAGLTRPCWRCFALCAAAGLRIGEATAVQPGDYDPATGRLTIRHTRTRLWGLGTPKSRASCRTILVPPQARPALEAGVPNTHYSAVYAHWKRFLARLGLPYRNPHQLKHSVASLLVARGVPIADAAAYCGDTFGVFVKTYVHPVGTEPGDALAVALGGDTVAPPAPKAARTPGKPRARRGS